MLIGEVSMMTRSKKEGYIMVTVFLRTWSRRAAVFLTTWTWLCVVVGVKEHGKNLILNTAYIHTYHHHHPQQKISFSSFLRILEQEEAKNDDGKRVASSSRRNTRSTQKHSRQDRHVNVIINCVRVWMQGEKKESKKETTNKIGMHFALHGVEDNCLFKSMRVGSLASVEKAYQTRRRTTQEIK